MSIIFGVLKERGGIVTKPEVLGLAEATNRYATGTARVYAAARVGMGFQSYVSHARSAMDDRPVTDPHGNAISFDGRLDNSAELATLLGLSYACVSDSEIVLSGFHLWGEDCFSRLAGDWALALWSAKDEALYLARDHAGSRTLYFTQNRKQVLWATYLDTLVSSGQSFRLSEDYVGCYLACSSARDLTPYEGIRAIPPAHYVIFRASGLIQHSHWSSVARMPVRYKSDGEYEQHFLALFRQSVERRTGPGAPILAQLSGGMDSTSIVCMSDFIRSSSDAGAELLDTISFYDDSESSLDERRYFMISEAKRGKTGVHMDAAFSQRTFDPPDTEEGKYLLPGADSFALIQERRLHSLMEERGYRSILSGIGGDEVLGGVPSALPELATYLVSGDLRKLLDQGIAWSLVDRTPLIHTIFETARYTVGLYAGSGQRAKRLPAWLSTSLRERVRDAEHEHSTWGSRLGIAPYRLDNDDAWRSVMETLPHLFPQILSRPEYRYPFLDKDLVNYLFAIPAEQLRRPGRRRSLMRRALREIVPEEILERRRKAFQLHAPLEALRKAEPKLEHLFQDSMISCAGFVDRDALRGALQGVIKGDAEGMQTLLRAIALEIWLRSAPAAFAPLSRQPATAGAT